MPSYPPIPTPENLPHGILLVEEYGALAVAISSALRKFASLHRVEVAHDFAEAEAAAARMQPELFVLDLDPPPAGEIAFLDRLQALYPEARALVLAASTSPALRAERRTVGAIQFIEKPFDLAEFGAAIQALVGPWAGPPGNVRGTLRDLSLLDITLIKCFVDSGSLLRLEKADGRTGELHFQKGQISHAATGGLIGVPALEEILRWPDAKWSADELPLEALRTIDTPRDELLLPAIRQEAEQRKLYSLGEAPAGPAPLARSGRKILVIDDTEMLLIFVADVLATAGQNFQVMTAASGGDGIGLAAEWQPDLILLDYSLADMTGDKVCRALLENQVTARIPVLMMSGHLTELARTAEDYANVVAALPKPFLSGALINAVEKALDDGPLPAPATPPPAAPIAPSASVEETAPPLPNGHSPGGDGAITKPSTASTTAIAEAAPPPPSPLTLPPRGSAADVPPVAAPVVRQTNLKVTFSLAITALRLTPLLQMGAVRLQPSNQIVAVEMEQATAAKEAVIETGFRLGQFQVADNGQIDTLRLIPTRQGFRVPEAASSFAVGDFNLRRKNSHREIELVAAPDQMMTVQLIAPFELLQVELSPAFEIKALLVRAGGSRVVLRNSGASEGSAFQLEEVELDPAGELQQLLVRPIV